MRIPKLPAGHKWNVETIDYEGKRTLLIIWKHPRGFHVESRAVRPRWYWIGYWRCYIDGLIRLRRDRIEDRRRERNLAYLNAAKSLAD